MDTTPTTDRLARTIRRCLVLFVVSVAFSACGESDPIGTLPDEGTDEVLETLAWAEYVRELVDGGKLANTDANPLLDLISTVGEHFEAGQAAEADGALNDLVTEIERLVEEGRLSEQDATPLLRAVDGLLADGIALTHVTAGSRHACGLTAEGKAYCWGDNEFGQLGAGATNGRTRPVPVSGDLTFVSLEAVGGFTCGLTAAGSAFCWGQNVGAQLGDGTLVDRLVPTPVSGGPSLVQLAPGADHVCALDASGQTFCWGGAVFGQEGLSIGRDHGLGFEADEPCEGRRDALFYLCESTPTAVPTDLRFADIGVGLWQSCGLTADGAAHCWGWNQTFCSLGLGVEPCETEDSTPIPQRVSATDGFIHLASGAVAHCGIVSSGEAHCWGQGTLAGSSEFGVPAATPLPGGVQFDQIDISGEDSVLGHACGIDRTGTGYCWGAGGSQDELQGNLGDGKIPPGFLCVQRSLQSRSHSGLRGPGVRFHRRRTGVLLWGHAERAGLLLGVERRRAARGRHAGRREHADQGRVAGGVRGGGGGTRGGSGPGLCWRTCARGRSAVQEPLEAEVFVDQGPVHPGPSGVDLPGGALTVRGCEQSWEPPERTHDLAAVVQADRQLAVRARH